MFSLQWNIENIIAPLFVTMAGAILCEVFRCFVEHIKKPHFFVDFLNFRSKITACVDNRHFKGNYRNEVIAFYFAYRA
ncbi:hypothetical protein C814_03350 [Anaerotruncus sp. G3(2012)]|nr:hypothetical protein C814_03350 [Anaerotruncus sp. G3(2012)]